MKDEGTAGPWPALGALTQRTQRKSKKGRGETRDENGTSFHGWEDWPHMPVLIFDGIVFLRIFSLFFLCVLCVESLVE